MAGIFPFSARLSPLLGALDEFPLGVLFLNVSERPLCAIAKGKLFVWGATFLRF